MTSITREKSLRALLLILSLLVAIAAGEAALRLFYPKSDIVPAEPEKDPILGRRILPYQSGHDEKGFRNDSARGPFPIVCIGDSFTYGNNVARRNAIPQQLGRLLKKPVYNMGMGGYGPAQYYYLLDEARRAGAEKIVIAFYLGNDITDAFSMSEGYEYWRFLSLEAEQDAEAADFEPCAFPCEMQEPAYSEPDLITIQLKSKESMVWQVHSFLRINSIFYAMTYEYALKPAVSALFEKSKHRTQPGTFYSSKIDTVFKPSMVLTALDLRNEKVARGLKVTCRVLELMSRKSQKHEVLFVLIPTKESVYYQFFKQHHTPLPAEYECQVHYESIIARRLEREITSRGFQCLDALPELERAALAGAALYPSSSDNHPNVTGYGLIAKTIYRALND